MKDKHLAEAHFQKKKPTQPDTHLLAFEKDLDKGNPLGLSLGIVVNMGVGEKGLGLGE